MLIINAYVDDILMDTVHIVNQNVVNMKGEVQYKVESASRHGVKSVWHKRSEGWEKLVIKALDKLRA